MKVLPLTIMVSMLLLVGLYVMGDISQESIPSDRLLASIHTVDVRVDTTVDSSRVSLFIEGESPADCTRPKAPSIEQVGEVFVVELEYAEAAECGESRSFRRTIDLGTEALEQGEYYVDVNGQPARFVVGEASTLFTLADYNALSYEKYPPFSLGNGNKAELRITIDGLLRDADWIIDAYDRALVNYAGHYVVLERPCAEDSQNCQAVIIVDALTGNTIHTFQFVGDALGYRPDSRLLVVNDPLRTDQDSGEVILFVIEDGEGSPYLREIASGDLAEYSTKE